MYSLEAALLIRYEVPKISQSAGYTYDLVANVVRLVIELFGSWAFCSDYFLNIFGPFTI